VSFLGLRTSRDRAETFDTNHLRVLARQLFEAGIEGEDLFEAMWEHHDRTGLEPRHIFAEYKALTVSPAAEQMR
jgi:hypothetical protein